MPRTPPEGREPARRPLARTRVLLAEKDLEQARGIASLLGDLCEVRTAHTLATALEALEAARYDGFIVDVDLPDGSGAELLAPIRARFPEEPILLMCCATA